MQATTTLTWLTILTMPAVRVVAHALPMTTIRTVQKSPSLTVVESWLSTVVSSLRPTVPRTICFKVRPDPTGARARCTEVPSMQRKWMSAIHPNRR